MSNAKTSRYCEVVNRPCDLTDLAAQASACVRLVLAGSRNHRLKPVLLSSLHRFCVCAYRSLTSKHPTIKPTTGRQHGTPKIGKKWNGSFRAWTWMHGHVLCLRTRG